MPNWVFNHLTIKKEYLGKIVNSDGKVDFNVAVPMPQSVIDMAEDSKIETDVYYYLSNRLRLSQDIMTMNKTLSEVLGIVPGDIIFRIRLISVNVPKGADPRECYIKYLHEQTTNAVNSKQKPDYERGKMLVDNYTKYGAMTWYDGYNKYWGCKWNASNSFVPEKENENGEITVEFDTPWCCPFTWLENLGNQKIPFYVEWIEEQGYHGEVCSDGENVVCRDLPDLTWDEEKEEYVEYKEEDE